MSSGTNTALSRWFSTSRCTSTLPEGWYRDLTTNLASRAPAIGDRRTGQYSCRASTTASVPNILQTTYTPKNPADTVAATAATFLHGDSLGISA